MSRVFPRQIKGTLPTAAYGDGVYIVDTDGKRYIDASGGAAVSCMGHSDEDIRRAIKQQVDTLAFAHTGFFTSQPAEELAEVLVDGAPAGIERVYFLSGGSEAIETSLKMARQYFLETGQPERRRFIARQLSYHGNTLGALAIGGHEARRRPYQPLLVDATHISPCYAYRGQQADESEEEYGLRVADELETAIVSQGPETVAAFVAETVGGATSGVIPPVPGYFKRIREICDRYGVLLILDEIMCGMGRTGTMHACEQDGIAPDLMTIAKGLGAGYQPIGAVLVSGQVYDAFAQGSGAFQHGHTYMGHPTACAAALAVQKAIHERNLLENVGRQGDLLETALVERFGNHPHIGDIRGRGLFRGLELVAERASRQPFDPAQRLFAKIKKEAMANGLVCYPGNGTADGVSGDHVLLAPPFIVTADQIGEIVDKLGTAIDAALESLPG